MAREACESGPRFGIFGTRAIVERSPHCLVEHQGRSRPRRNFRSIEHQMTTTQRSPGRIVALALLAGVALAGCQTVTGSPTTDIEDNQLAASPANLSSLSGV